MFMQSLSFYVLNFTYICPCYVPKNIFKYAISIIYIFLIFSLKQHSPKTTFNFTKTLFLLLLPFFNDH